MDKKKRRKILLEIIYIFVEIAITCNIIEPNEFFK